MPKAWHESKHNPFEGQTDEYVWTAMNEGMSIWDEVKEADKRKSRVAGFLMVLMELEAYKLAEENTKL